MPRWLLGVLASATSVVAARHATVAAGRRPAAALQLPWAAHSSTMLQLRGTRESNVTEKLPDHLKPARADPPASSIAVDGETSHGHGAHDAEGHGDSDDHGSDSDDHGHHSIFHIQIHRLDRVLFWFIITGMLAFTILVDRAQWLATYMAGSSRCNVMFLNRVISELMMFGVVAISVFLFSQLTSVDGSTHLLFEFVDILCSFAACFLILMGIILFLLRRALETRLNTWNPEKQQECADLLRTAKTIDEIPAPYHQRLNFEVMRAQFFARHKLSMKIYSYNFHLIESLNQDICDLININWMTWVITLAVSIGILIGRWALGDSMDTHPSMHPHILLFCVITWLVWLACMVLFGIVQRRLRQLHEKLGLTTLEGLRAGYELSKEIGKALTTGRLAQGGLLSLSDADLQAFSRFAEVTSQSIQVLGLGLCFMLGFYVMHVAYNIDAQHLGWHWHFLFLFPLLTGLFLVLPLALQAHALLMAFCGPDQDVMDAVVTQVAETHSDLKFVREQMESGAATAGVSGLVNVEKWAIETVRQADEVLSGRDDGVIVRGEFYKILKTLGANVSRERTSRLYTRLTHGGNKLTYRGFVVSVFHPETADLPLAPE